MADSGVDRREWQMAESGRWERMIGGIGGMIDGGEWQMEESDRWAREPN